MKKVKASIIGIAVFLVLLSAVSAVDATVVKVEPVTQPVLSGQSFSVNVTVEGITSMGADQATLNFDPNAMSVTGVTEGDFLKTAGATIGAGFEIIDPTNGFVTFSYALTTYGANVTGSGTLATIYFDTNASADDIFDLNLTDVLLADGYGVPITVDEIYNGTVVLDKTPPIMTIITPIEGKNYSSICVELNVSAEDDKSEIDCIWYSLDGGENVTIFDNGNAGITVYGNAVISDLTQCGHNIVVYVNNTVGKVSHSEVSFTVYPGDVKGDAKVDVFDLQRLAWAFNSHPEDSNWNENANLNCDVVVNVFDLQILAWNFGKNYADICGIA